MLIYSLWICRRTIHTQNITRASKITIVLSFSVVLRLHPIMLIISRARKSLTRYKTSHSMITSFLQYSKHSLILHPHNLVCNHVSGMSVQNIGESLDSVTERIPSVCLIGSHMISDTSNFFLSERASPIEGIYH